MPRAHPSLETNFFVNVVYIVVFGVIATFAFRCRHLAQTHPILYQTPQTPALPFACPILVYWISSVCVSLSSFLAS
jgi:hypothetical protein